MVWKLFVSKKAKRNKFVNRKLEQRGVVGATSACGHYRSLKWSEERIKERQHLHLDLNSGGTIFAYWKVI
jgi:hypothetical protein